MTNRIDGPGGPGGFTPTAEVDETPQVDGAGFEDALESVDGASASGVSPLGELDNAVAAVVDQVRSGELTDPVAITERVIDRLVQLRFGHLGEDVSASMTASVRQALIHDPYFVMEVETLIASALERKPV
jgi:hypothetical protein